MDARRRLLPVQLCLKCARITNNRRFSPVWQSFVLSKEDQVDRILEPDNCHNYRDFATQFYNHDLVYLSLRLIHRGHRHGILVVMDNKKLEFQVLDSLWRSETYIKKIEMMRTGIQRMTSFARQRSPNLPDDLGTWTICPIDNLPQQDDGKPLPHEVEVWRTGGPSPDSGLPEVAVMQSRFPALDPGRRGPPSPPQHHHDAAAERNTVVPFPYRAAPIGPEPPSVRRILHPRRRRASTSRAERRSVPVTSSIVGEEADEACLQSRS